MNQIGILQGRLSPAPPGRAQCFPRHRWRDEFSHAGALGFTAIEWLITCDAIDANPLWSERGAEDIRETSDATGVAVHSICADFLIEQPQLAGRLEHTVVCASRIGAGVVLVPVLEGNALRDCAHAREFLAGVAPAIRAAERTGVMLALESDWPGDRLAQFLFDMRSAPLGAYCDTGNAAADGRDPSTDLRALGPLVRGVHIKDRTRGGPSVPIGQGSVDFTRVVETLGAIGFCGVPILETPVGDDAVASAGVNLAMLRGAVGAKAVR